MRCDEAGDGEAIYLKKQGRQVSARGRGSCNGEEAMAMARGEEITAGEAAAERQRWQHGT